MYNIEQQLYFNKKKKKSSVVVVGFFLPLTALPLLGGFPQGDGRRRKKEKKIKM